MVPSATASSDPGADRVEVVDANGQITSVVSRAEMRRDVLRHRCSYVVVLRSSGDLVVHQRAPWKDVLPLFWDVCFGGVVDVGEAWREAAERELQEEAGLMATTAFVDLGPVSFDGPNTNVVGWVYLLVSDEAVTCPDGEVVAVQEVPMATIAAWVEEHDVCEDSHEVVLPLVVEYFEQHLKSL